jgi:pilus assembly protein FimV
LIGVGLIALAGTAMLFLRRRQPDAGDAASEWDALDANIDDLVDTTAATGRMHQPVESNEPDFLVEEQPPEPAAPEPMPELGPMLEPEPDPEPTMEPLLDPTLEEMLTSDLDPDLDPGPELEPTIAPDDGSPSISSSASISRTMTIGKPDEEPAFDDTISSQTLINLEQADPVAEADFHMAYGLYDQAAELVEKALDADPGRRDLKLKLLEVFFVWGNKESFLDTAQALRSEIGSGPDSEWDKVVIMGKQICPDNALFSAATASAGAVDVDLEAGESPSLDMAFDLDAGADASDGSGVDLDASMVEQPAEEGLDLGAQTLAGLETAIFERPDGVDDETSPNLDADILAATQDSPTLNMPVEATAESPSFDPIGADLADSLGSTGDQSAEITLEDLGLEDGTLAGLADDDVLSSSGVDEVLGESSAETETHGTATGIALDLDDLVSALGDDDTVAEPVAQTVGSDVLAGTETDLNLDTTSDQSGLLDPSTMTMTEVGTKLDLARAYVDMGDADGARAILEEVVVEGDPGQQQEAQTLIDSL